MIDLTCRIRDVCVAILVSAACLGIAAAAASDMVAIEGGAGVTGAETHYREEPPVRVVTVGPFLVGRTAVTNARFRACVEATGDLTTVERHLNPDDRSGWPPEAQVPGAMVFAQLVEARIGAQRVVKGGSWPRAPANCMRYRPSARLPVERGLGSNHIGSRIVRDVEGRVGSGAACPGRRRKGSRRGAVRRRWRPSTAATRCRSGRRRRPCRRSRARRCGRRRRRTRSGRPPRRGRWVSRRLRSPRRRARRS